jgi:AcrR family transcriptional regulator
MADSRTRAVDATGGRLRDGAGEFRREDIVREATKLFGTRGYTSTSLREVSSAIGISKAGLYHHFPTKEAILEEIAENALSLLEEQLEQVLEMDAPVRNKIRALVIGRVEIMAANQSALSVFWQERGLMGTRKNEELNDRMRAYHRSAVQLIELGQRDGLVRPDVDPHMAVLGLVGLTGWTYLWYNPRGKLTPAEIGDSFWALLESGLCVSDDRRQ